MLHKKLAAILFSDIVGYTALMGKDESRAYGLLLKNKTIHEKVVGANQGKIIKELGDGLLCLFESVSEAVFAASKLQSEVNKLGLFQIRIGIEYGELISENDDVYGDAVNLASRIQSVGTPGSILFSEKVYFEIKNKKEFDCKFLGAIPLKNVNAPMNIYYLSGSHLEIPVYHHSTTSGISSVSPSQNKKYYIWALGFIVLLFLAYFLFQKFKGKNNNPEILYQLIQIFPFENQTGDSEFDALGLLAKDWLTQALIETKQANVIRDENLKISKASSEKESEKISRNAGIFIKGKIYSTNPEKITIVADVVDARNNLVLYSVKPINGTRNNIIEPIEQLKQKILGYFATKDFLYGHVPPNYAAYQEFVKANAVPNDQILRKESHLLKSIELDSTFIQAYFTLIELTTNWGHGQLLDSVTQLIEQRKSYMSNFQIIQWSALQARMKGDILLAAEMYWKMYSEFKIEYGATQAIYHFVAQNFPKRAIEKYRLFIPKEKKPDSGNPRDQAYVGEVFEAMLQLEQYDSVKIWYQNLAYEPTHFSIAAAYIHALTMLEEYERVDSLLQVFKTTIPTNQRFYTPPMMAWKVCGILYLKDKMELLKKYTSILSNINREFSKNMFFHYFESMVAFYEGRYEEAALHYLEHYDNTPQFRFFPELAAVCYFLAGQKKKAEEWMLKIEKDGLFYPGQREYAKAVYSAYVNPSAITIQLLTDAFSNGFEFDFYAYGNDPLLKPIAKEPAFLDFVKPK
ncbi:MAG: adenylate/guanylate cyclase domain-containing protein [Saprospiraceae bacterium]|nr:adenylate/guanylate cyclase domain-containing protein [Saprospiraceae bacterium]